MAGAPEAIWAPSPNRIERAAITRFARSRGLPEDYGSLWGWSVEHLDEFWAAIWDHFGVEADSPYERVLGRREMPGAEWFPGARLNFARHVFRDRDDDDVAIRHASELRPLSQWTWGRLRAETARVAAGLRAAGVGPGDRVAAFMPNIPETAAAFLACSSIGAVWTSAAPEFGAPAVGDRFGQIEPKLLLAVDGYRYAGRDFDCAEKVAEIEAGLPATRVVRFGYRDESGWEDGFLGDAELSFEPLDFSHPLWILYSSGTTGLPKPIVHSQGGVLIEYLKAMHLHFDAQAGDRVFWFTTTGWVMWNVLLGALLTPASIVLYDGSPAGDALWDLAAEAGVTTFGVSAAWIAAQAKAGAEPSEGRDLSAIAAVGSTGSPLSPEGFRWVYDKLGPDLWLFSISGGTDVASAFLAGVPTLPVHVGELQARALGVSVEAWSQADKPVVGEVGELVVTKPMPSMPVGLWGDDDGSRYHDSYFAMFPGVWRHGDWLEVTERGSGVIHGRSDSTINRAGVRMGTSEIYRAVLGLDAVLDALVVDVPRAGGESWMPLFVVLAEGVRLDDGLAGEIAGSIRRACSPRHVPDDVIQILEVPRTLSGKPLEVPVKRVLAGDSPEQSASRDSLQNPEAFDWFVEFARSRG